MKRRLSVVLLTLLLGFGLCPSQSAGIEWFGGLFGPHNKTYPAPKTYTPPTPAKPPYYGQALGTTYYRYGYFGAKPHEQCWHHLGYYDEYVEGGKSKGY